MSDIKWYRVMDIAMSPDGKFRLLCAGLIPGQGGYEGYGYNSFIFNTMEDLLTSAAWLAKDEVSMWKEKIEAKGKTDE